MEPGGGDVGRDLICLLRQYLTKNHAPIVIAMPNTMKPMIIQVRREEIQQ